MMTDLSDHFADYIVATRYEALPQNAVDAAKKSMLDILGVMLAASGLEPAVQGVIELVQETGGRPESSVLGFGGRAPASWAAFANGAMAHCMDFDDLTPWGNHASSSIIPAVLAVAERKGGVSGRDLISAIAVGQDLFARLLRNVTWRKDWNMSTVVGVYAATAAAGRILGLSRDQMAHALGIATMQSSGTMEVIYGVGGDLRGMYAAFSAQGAVVAALLAAKGIAGPKTLFEGKVGFFNTYFAGNYDRAGILDGLGTDYQGATTLYKPWPAVGPAHSHIHATIELVSRHGLSAEDIREIRVHAGDYQQIMCSPLESRRAPSTLVDAKFSLPFLVAVAAVRRGVRLSDFTDEALKDAQVLAVAQKVVPVPDANFDWKFELPLGRVAITATDGRTFELTGVDVPGSSAAPLSWDDVARKFGECSALAHVPPSPAQIGAMQRTVQQLESLDDASELLGVLA